MLGSCHGRACGNAMSLHAAAMARWSWPCPCPTCYRSSSVGGSCSSLFSGLLSTSVSVALRWSFSWRSASTCAAVRGAGSTGWQQNTGCRLHPAAGLW